MFGKIKQLAVVFPLLLIVLSVNPRVASARRPSTVASKTYASGKLPVNLSGGTAATAEANQLKPASTSSRGKHVRIESPLHASLPHSTRQAPRMAVVLSETR